MLIRKGPEVSGGKRAAIQNKLGLAYTDLTTDRAANLQKGHRRLPGGAAGLYREGFSGLWAETQNNLGNAYADLPTGDRNANLQSAKACLESALRVLLGP
jgi:hypothetical protein